MATKLIVFSGPSGSGKSTIVKRLMDNNFLNAEFSVSATNRPPRKGEKHGEHYYFLTTDDFSKKIENDDFVEWEQVYEGRFYGTLRTEVENIRIRNKHVLFDIDAVGGLNIKKFYGDEAVLIYVKPPSLEVLRKRLENRGTETAESLKTRLSKAEYELSLATGFDAQVVNDNLDTAVQQVKEVLKQFEVI